MYRVGKYSSLPLLQYNFPLEAQRVRLGIWNWLSWLPVVPFAWWCCLVGKAIWKEGEKRENSQPHEVMGLPTAQDQVILSRMVSSWGVSPGHVHPYLLGSCAVIGSLGLQVGSVSSHWELSKSASKNILPSNLGFGFFPHCYQAFLVSLNS